ncbi:MAG: restriction endonuclease subunit S [Defluviitaleaceae bacterium]|nr:restriction endonuclease subunit S [Defluviitaleaceae bacterium]
MGKLALLGDYTKIKTGKLDANASSENGKYPFFTCSKIPLEIDSYSYDCECVLVAGNGDLNVKYYEGKFDAYQRTYIIESLDKQKLDVKYLYYFLDMYVEQLREMSIGGVIKYIKLGYLTEAQIPLPTMKEQREISDILDHASTLIEKRKAQIAKLDLLIKSQFIAMFGDPVLNPIGWKMKRLKEIVKIKSSKRVYQRELTTEGIPFLRVSDLVSRITCDTDICDLYISDELFDNFIANGLVPKANDILVTSRGTLGLCYIVKSTDRFYFQDGMISWLKKQEHDINSLYLAYLFQSDFIRKQIDQVSSGSTVNYISLANLSDFKILFPPLDMQNRFAAFVTKVEKSKTKMQQALAQQQLLYKSLMQKCISANFSC